MPEKNIKRTNFGKTKMSFRKVQSRILNLKNNVKKEVQGCQTALDKLGFTRQGPNLKKSQSAENLKIIDDDADELDENWKPSNFSLVVECEDDSDQIAEKIFTNDETSHKESSENSLTTSGESAKNTFAFKNAFISDESLDRLSRSVDELLTEAQKRSIFFNLEEGLIKEEFSKVKEEVSKIKVELELANLEITKGLSNATNLVSEKGCLCQNLEGKIRELLCLQSLKLKDLTLSLKEMGEFYREMQNKNNSDLTNIRNVLNSCKLDICKIQSFHEDQAKKLLSLQKLNESNYVTAITVATDYKTILLIIILLIIVGYIFNECLPGYFKPLLYFNLVIFILFLYFSLVKKENF